MGCNQDENKEGRGILLSIQIQRNVEFGVKDVW